MSANLASFSPGKFTDVTVGLGQIKRLEFALSLAGVAETVSVTAESPLVDVKQSARQTNIRAEQVELLPHGRDFTIARDAGTGRQPGSQARRPVDRRRERRRESLHHRRHRDDEPGQRPVGQEPDRRLRGRSPGEVERLHGGVRRRDGRRDQRHHQERRQQLARQWTALLPRRQPERRQRSRAGKHRFDALDRASDTPPQARERARGRVHHLSGRQADARRAGLLHWWPGRHEQGLVLCRVSARFDQHHARRQCRDERQPRGQRAVGRAKRAGAVPDGEPDGADRTGPPHPRGLQQQLEQEGRHPPDAERIRSGRVRTTPRPAYSPTGALSGNVDWVATPKLFFGARGGYYTSDQHDTNVLTDPRFTFGQHVEHRAGRRSCRSAARVRFLELPRHGVQWRHPQSADARILPGGRHGLRPGGW